MKKNSAKLIKDVILIAIQVCDATKVEYCAIADNKIKK